MMRSTHVVAFSLIFIGLFHLNHGVVVPTVDDCAENGDAQTYQSHSSSVRSSYSSGGYGTHTHHPSPSGYGASSSQYVRTGSASSIPVSTFSAQSAALNSGYKAGMIGNSEDDNMQVATSYFSPTVVDQYGSSRSSNYQNSGGYGIRQGSATYDSSVDSQSTHHHSGSSYGGLRQGSSGYGSVHQNTGSVAGSDQSYAYDSNVRSKYENLKHKADAFVHSGAPPPVEVSVPAGSTNSIYSSGTRSGSSYGSRYQNSQRYGATSESSGNVLGTSYGSTAVESEDDTQRLVPVPVSISPSSSALVSQHNEQQGTRVTSYSTSGAGVAPNEESINFSLTGHVPVVPVGSAAGISSSSYGTRSGGSSSSQAAKDFEEFKRKADAFVHEGSAAPTSHISSDSLQQSTHVETLPARSTNRGTIVVPVKVTVTREQTVIPGSTDYAGNYYRENEVQGGSNFANNKESYSSQSSSSLVTQTVDKSGNVVYSQAPSVVYSSKVSGGQTVPKVYTVGPNGELIFPKENEAESEQFRVHRDKVIIPGSVPIFDKEEYERRSNKVFDMVSGYGTFLPPKEEQQNLKPDQHLLVDVNNPHTSVSGSQGASSISRSQSAGYSGTSSNYQSGYQGVSVPVNTVKKTTTVYSYNSNNGVALPSTISPGVPLGDPVTPPEVSGSYFRNGKRYYESQYGAESGSNTDASKWISSDASRAYSSGYGGSRYSSESAINNVDSSFGHSSGYGVKSVPSGGLTNVGNAGAIQSHSAYHSSNYNTGSGGGLVVDPNCNFCNEGALLHSSSLGGSTGGAVKKYGISSSWSSKSQTVNGKTVVDAKEASVTVNDNGKIDTYATHNRK